MMGVPTKKDLPKSIKVRNVEYEIIGWIKSEPIVGFKFVPVSWGGTDIVAITITKEGDYRQRHGYGGLCLAPGTVF